MSNLSLNPLHLDDIDALKRSRTSSWGKRKPHDLTSQYNAGGYIPQLGMLHMDYYYYYYYVGASWRLFFMLWWHMSSSYSLLICVIFWFCWIIVIIIIIIKERSVTLWALFSLYVVMIDLIMDSVMHDVWSATRVLY